MFRRRSSLLNGKGRTGRRMCAGIVGLGIFGSKFDSRFGQAIGPTGLSRPRKPVLALGNLNRVGITYSSVRHGVRGWSAGPENAASGCVQEAPVHRATKQIFCPTMGVIT